MVCHTCVSVCLAFQDDSWGQTREGGGLDFAGSLLPPPREAPCNAGPFQLATPSLWL